ncbi:MAG: T9SS type A sorting domain-containing protein, partial [Fibrobacteria bacterium]|nr:T9SS type A sorting domain-containing protein [Fibrobacteria bacterium]
FTYDGDEGHLYVNGQKRASGKPDPGAWSFFRLFGFRPLRLAVPSYDETFFKGCVDDLHFLSRALSEEELASVYYSGMYRVSGDGGETWTAWEKLELSATDGTKEPVSVSVSGVPLPVAADSMNRIEFTVRDIYGNTAVRQYTLLGNDAVPVMPDVENIGKVSFAPNPFYDATALTFSVAVHQKVEIDVFGINGKQIKNLTSRFYTPGKHSITWNGKGEQERVLSAGQYFVRIKTGKHMIVKKIMKLQ